MSLGASGLVLLAAVSAAGTPATLIAAETVADSLLRQGIDLRRTGDDEGALRAFQQAYAIDHSPRALAQVGLAEQALGLWADAEGHLGEALRDGAGHAWIQKNRATLTEALFTVKKHVARLELVGLPAGARVSLSGRQVGTAPLPGPLRVNEGPVGIKVEADGWRASHRDVTVTGGQFLRLSIELEPLGSSPRPAEAARPPPPALRRMAAPPPAEASAPGADLRTSVEEHATVEGQPSGGHTWLWVALGVVAAAGATTTILLVTRKTEYPMAEHHLP